MGIVNKKVLHTQPVWRTKMNNGEALNESEKKDLLFDVEANKKEINKMWDETRNNINAAWKDIPKQTNNFICDVKGQINREVENKKKMIENTYNDYRKQYDEGIKKAKQEWKKSKEKWKDEYDNAKKSLESVKKAFENGDWKQIGNKLTNGFVGFMKQDLKDTLNIDIDNKGVPIVRQIANAAIGIVKNAFEKNWGGYKKQNVYWATGMHGLMAIIGKNTMYDKTGCILTYTEIDDYISNMFPIRMLEIEVPVTSVTKIIKSKKREINGQKYAYDMILSCRVATDDVFPQIPINVGKYIAILKDNDNIININDEIKTDSNIKQNDLISAQKVKLIFYLYTEQELQFQVSPMINYVLDNPKPLEIIMKSFELTNPNIKILYSELENDVDMGKIVIPHMSFTDLIKFLDDEVGLYNTNYTEFYENGVYMLLNTNNPDKINVAYKPFQSKIELFIDRHKSAFTYPRYILKKENTYQASCDINDVKIEVRNDFTYNDSTLYIRPEGYRNYYDNPMSRKTNVVRKLTNVSTLKKDNTKQIETLTFDLNGFPINNITPLTNVFILDAAGNMRVYRVCYKEIVVNAFESTKTRIKAFRRVEK